MLHQRSSLEQHLPQVHLVRIELIESSIASTRISLNLEMIHTGHCSGKIPLRYVLDLLRTSRLGWRSVRGRSDQLQHPALFCLPLDDECLFDKKVET